MIVQVRGASGAGKSTLVRQFVERHGPPEKYMRSNAGAWGLDHVDSPLSRPFALGVRTGQGQVIVPGHYESAGGGADMIKSKTHIYDVVDKAVSNGCHVLVESLFLSKDVGVTKERSMGWLTTFKVIYIDLPEEVCEESVQVRREAMGRERRPLRQHANDYKETTKAVKQLRDAGFDVEVFTDRAAAAARVEELLG